MRLLLLAGTAEARQLAAALAALRAGGVIASLARADRAPEPLGLPTRIGRFAGDDAFRDFLKDERIGAVLDATHPFATRISRRAARIAGEAGLPYAQLLRPAWRPGPGDDWRFAHDMADVARHLPRDAAVFMGTGPEGLEDFKPGPGRAVWIRRLDALDEPFPYAEGGWIQGGPSPDLKSEVALFRRLDIGCVVMRNAGGTASRAKLEATRALALPVVMIRRPLQPEAIRLDSVTAAIAWVRRLY